MSDTASKHDAGGEKKPTASEQDRYSVSRIAVDRAELAALREKVSDLEAELSAESEALDEINARNKQLRSQLEAAEAALAKAKSAYEHFFDEANAIIHGTSTDWQHLSLDQWRTRRECMAAVLALFPDMGNPAYR